MLREDVVAPALVLVVILGVWWVGARVVEELWNPGDTVAAPNTEPPATAAPRQAGADPAQHARAPAASPEARLPNARDSSPSSRGSPESVAPGDASATADTAPANTPAATGTTGATDAIAVGVSQQDVDTLRARRLRVPVEGVDRATLMSNFHQARGTGSHEAMDIMAPRGTPILAVESGRIAKLFTSERGGLTIYQFDPSESFCYYYAHLDRYSHTLDEGKLVSAGEVIGYVGSSGNASPDAPHLHFAVFKLGPDRHWWQGLPIDPYLVLR
jgi:peptidoglycan LD-endopeptidase LytH